jgi:hypothetical protein
VRLDHGTLDSSPFSVTLQLSEDAWRELEAAAITRTTNSGDRFDDNLRRLASAAAALVHCEVVFPDGSCGKGSGAGAPGLVVHFTSSISFSSGRQVTLYSRDLPHSVPIAPLEVCGLAASRVDRQVTLGLQRNLPLSSSHGNSEFRLALLYASALTGTVALYTNAFRVLAKMGHPGTRPKQQHFTSYVQLPPERARKVLLLQVRGGIESSVLQVRLCLMYACCA